MGRVRGAEVPAGAGVHGTHEHEGCRVGHAHGSPGYRDHPVLQRLAEHLQDAPFELRKLVQEEHAVVGEADLPGTGDRSSAYENKPVIVEKVIELKRPLLNERQKFFLKMLEEKGKVARAEYMKMFKRKFSRITLYWDLRVLIELGIIEKIKVGRFVYYRLKSRSER